MRLWTILFAALTIALNLGEPSATAYGPSPAANDSQTALMDENDDGDKGDKDDEDQGNNDDGDN